MKLQGIQDTTPQPKEVTLSQLIAMDRDDSLWGIMQLYSVEPTQPHPVSILTLEVQKLVDQYADIFSEPTGIPPKKSTHPFYSTGSWSAAISAKTI